MTTTIGEVILNNRVVWVVYKKAWDLSEDDLRD